MKGKTVVITGGTSGIGEITAERLAQMGARIVLIARDKSRGEATMARLYERAPSLGHAVHYAVTPEIAHTARREAAYREIGALIDAELLATNLLSSMPL